MITRLARFFVRSPTGDFNCAAQDSPSWDERAAVAVDLAVALPWTGRVRVADFGAGNQRLREVLTERLGVPPLYEPYDLRPQQASTRQLDVERELPEGPFDIAFCLGLIEYLGDPHDFLHRLSAVCRFAVPSYVIADGAERLSARQRRARGWKSHLTRASFESLLEDSFEIRGRAATNRGRTSVWLAESRSTKAA
jgi:hypothetical protein